MITKSFAVGGLGIAFATEEPIADSDFFPLFLQSAGNAPNYTVTLRRGPLPRPEGTEVFRTNHRSRVLAADTVYDYTCFSDAGTLTHIPYACAVKTGNRIDLTVNYEGPLWDTMLFDAINVPDLALAKNIGILHASFIDAAGLGILFAGPKQQGKSTQAMLWQQNAAAEILNGDRAAVRFKEGTLIACSVPFCGSSKECKNKQLPVKAIVFPQKAPLNAAEPLLPFAAFKLLIGCLSYTQTDAVMQEKALRLAEQIAAAVPCYSLRCTPDARAVAALKEAID